MFDALDRLPLGRNVLRRFQNVLFSSIVDRLLYVLLHGDVLSLSVI